MYSHDLMNEYKEEDFLMLSGIQHFCFCRRQWALIHVEQQWLENVLTVEGQMIHERCHDDGLYEKRNNLIIVGGLRISSRSLGAIGKCDVVEFRKVEEGCRLNGQEGLWCPYPVEYKHGKTKEIDADRLQLCCQAMCLEEMLKTDVPAGAIYYAETHRREEINFTDVMRKKVMDMFGEMHDYYQRGYTPRVKPHSGCRSCSLKEICLPVICRGRSVEKYYQSFLQEDKE